MLAILNSLNANNLPNFQPILIILVSKFMVHRALPDKTYSSLGLLSPLKPDLGLLCPLVAVAGSGFNQIEVYCIKPEGKIH